MKMNSHKFFVTNIDVKGKDFSHVMKLKGDMIVKKEFVSYKRDGTPQYKLSLNVEFWKNLVKEKGSVSICLDEAHILLNPRRSMSKVNVLMNDWLSMLRRVIGSQDGSGQQELILITQLSRRIDIVAKELASDINYVVSHYISRCSKCGHRWNESNETANKFYRCPKCNDWHIHKIKFFIEVYCFKNIDAFNMFYEGGVKTYYSRYMINNIESIFNNYNTLQWDDMMSEFY